MARIELVITKVDGEVVYREEADDQIDFTGHLADGSMIESGLYFSRCDIEGVDEAHTGYFAIIHDDGRVYSKGVEFRLKVPKVASPNFSILRCSVRDERRKEPKTQKNGIECTEEMANAIKAHRLTQDLISELVRGNNGMALAN